jgi:glucose-6-phosphate isomerase
MKRNTMSLFRFEYIPTSHIDSSSLGSLHSPLGYEITHIKKALESSQYDSPYTIVNLPTDNDLLNRVQEIIIEKKKQSPTLLIVIGIGGSNLGTMAVHEAINGTFYNELNPLMRVYFADTVDTDSIAAIRSLMQIELEKGNNVLLNVISKSGSTTETIANFEVLLDELKRFRKDTWHDFVVATTDKGSPLWNWAILHKCSSLEIPQKIGGRYSVFSAVGLFPLGLLGVDIKQLRAGAADMIKNCIGSDLRTNYATAGAATAYALYKKGFMIHNLFIFDSALKSLGDWNRQLVAESLGKKESIAGNLVETGITPTVSIGSTDMHSMAQLYLAGPYHTFFTFITVQQTHNHIQLPQWKEFDALVAHIQGKSLETIMDAIENGTKFAFAQNERPFMSIEFPEKSAYYIGQFMQYKMIETIYLGKLFDINPFDQPAVESYKQETKRILAHE